jgi:hypothetical protein
MNNLTGFVKENMPYPGNEIYMDTAAALGYFDGVPDTRSLPSEHWNDAL